MKTQPINRTVNTDCMDEDVDVRRNVAQNTNTSAETLEKLAGGESVYVQRSALASLRKKGEVR